VSVRQRAVFCPARRTERETGVATDRADVAFGGAFYAIVDSEAVGLPIDAAHLPELRRVGMEIKDAIESVHEITHPLERGLHGIYGTIFTGPPSDEGADLRNVTGVRRCRSGSSRRAAPVPQP
jgi:proline racemase